MKRSILACCIACLYGAVAALFFLLPWEIAVGIIVVVGVIAFGRVWWIGERHRPRRPVHTQLVRAEDEGDFDYEIRALGSGRTGRETVIEHKGHERLGVRR